MDLTEAEDIKKRWKNRQKNCTHCNGLQWLRDSVTPETYVILRATWFVTQEGKGKSLIEQEPTPTPGRGCGESLSPP